VAWLQTQLSFTPFCRFGGLIEQQFKPAKIASAILTKSRIEGNAYLPIERSSGRTSIESILKAPDFRVAKLISAPDRRSIRRQFQSKLPRRLWDASTGPDRIVLHHNSFERDKACLECIYPDIPEENAHFKHVAEVLNVSLERVLAGEPITADDA
jgi:hypothetical protein